MKCPACDSKLHEYDASAFKVDICRDGCSGIWFDHAEFEKCDQHSEAFPADLLRVRKQAGVVIDRNKKRACPKCNGQVLKRVVLDPETRFEIDTCPGCAGHWLDIGELEIVRAREKSNTELDARIAAFNQEISKQLKTVDGAHRVKAFIKLITGK